MDIRIIANKTLIIPETAPLLLKPEKLEVDCRWQYIKQQGELLQAEGMADFRLAYLTLSPEAYDDCGYEELLQLLDEVACNPQPPQLRHCLTISSPLEICENIAADCEIIGLQLLDLGYELISPRALELQMEFGVELKEKQLPPTKEEIKMEIREELKEEIYEEKEIRKEPAPAPCEQKEDCPCKEPAAEMRPAPCEEENQQEPSPQPCREESEEKKAEEKKAEEKEAEQNAEVKPLCRPRFSAARQNSFRKDGQERPKSSYSMKFYRVREGDSLWTIAEKMQVPAAEISRINKLEDGEIRPGMLLSVPQK